MILAFAYVALLSFNIMYSVNAFWDHDIFVDGNKGVDTESCLLGSSPCASINMALSGLTINSSVLYISPGNYTLEPGAETNITGKHQIAIIGSGKDTVIICEPSAGLWFSSSSDVMVESVTFLSCGQDIFHSERVFDYSDHFYYRQFFFRHFHFRAALCIMMCNNTALKNVHIQYSDGTGLLLIDIGGNLTVENSSIIDSKANLTNIDPNPKETLLIGNGIIILAGVQAIYNITMSTTIITNNAFKTPKSACRRDCLLDTGGGVSLLIYNNFVGKVLIDSCLIVNNSRGIAVYGLDDFAVEIRDTFINNYDDSVLYILDYSRYSGSSFELYQVNMTDNLLIFSDKGQSYQYFPNGYTIASSSLNISVKSPEYDITNYPSFKFKNRYCVSYSCDRTKTCDEYKFEDEYYYDPCPLPYYTCYNDHCICADHHSGVLCGGCKDGYSVAINSYQLSCIACNNTKTVVIGWTALIGLEFVPVTVMVAIIAILNVNLNQGSLSAYIFFCQILTVSFPSVGYPAWTVPGLLGEDSEMFEYSALLLSPLSILNLDFINFLHLDSYSGGIPICISQNTTPLGAISFWYLIALYPLMLVTLLYVCVSLYGKGYRCVVYIIRPFHRILARFWRMFDIQSSLTHTAASVYTLCFTQLAAISFKILHSTRRYGTVFFYDGRQNYFSSLHGLAGTFAVLVLLLLITTTLYLSVYPFQLFQKFFSKAKFNKEFLISLTDVFTGPYKDGTENSWDYRYFAGIHFALRLIIMTFYYIPLDSFPTIPAIETSLCFLTLSTVVIFRPYKKNIHTFSEALLLMSLAGLSLAGVDGFVGLYFIMMPIVCFVLFIVVAYCLFWVIRKCKFGHRYVKSSMPKPSKFVELVEERPSNDNIMFADRLMNPDSYEEHHISVCSDSVDGSDQTNLATGYINVQ